MVGIKFTLLDVEVDEDNHFADNPRDYVMSLSEKKGRAASKKISEGIVAAADTIVYLDGQILNKPKDADDAARMLNLLSGRTHQVFTGFTLLQVPIGKIIKHCETTDVTFRKLDADEIEDYIQSGAPLTRQERMAFKTTSAPFLWNG